MEVSITNPVSKAEQALINATTPQETKRIEEASAAEIAWAREQRDYERVVEAERIYILARCKTTELILPTIRASGGRPGNSNDNVTVLADYGFTRMQWERRRRELESLSFLDDYFDDCIEKGIEPTKTGLVRFAGKKARKAEREEIASSIVLNNLDEEATVNIMPTLYGIIRQAVKDEDAEFLLSDDCLDWCEMIGINYESIVSWAETGCKSMIDVLLTVLDKQAKELGVYLDP